MWPSIPSFYTSILIYVVFVSQSLKYGTARLFAVHSINPNETEKEVMKCPEECPNSNRGVTEWTVRWTSMVHNLGFLKKGESKNF